MFKHMSLFRSNLVAFMLFCVLNVFVYALPAHWMWGERGWLKALGCIDIAGSGTVHGIGGISGEYCHFYVLNWT